MVALCPTCHTKATFGFPDPEYSKEALRDYKRSPHNKRKEFVQYGFRWEQSILPVRINQAFMCAPNIIKCDNETVLGVAQRDGLLFLSLVLKDRHGQDFLRIEDNNWKVARVPQLWDLEYKPGNLRIRFAPRDIVFHLRVGKGFIEIRGTLEYLNTKIVMEPNGFKIFRDGVGSTPHEVISGGILFDTKDTVFHVKNGGVEIGGGNIVLNPGLHGLLKAARDR